MFTMFLFFLSGLIVELRIFEKIFSEKLISRELMTKIGTTIVVFNFILLFFSPKNLIFAILIFGSNIFILILSEKALRKVRLSQFRKHFLIFLTTMTLQMKMGRNFSQAFVLALDYQPSFYREKLRELHQTLFFSDAQVPTSSTPLLLAEVFDELKQIKSRPQNAINAVQNLKQRILISEKHRMRSKIMSQQCRIQTIVLSLLYFALLIYSFLNMELQKHFELLLVSLTFYLIGISLVLFIGRSHKWSV